MYRLANSRVGAATANVGDVVVDIVVARVRKPFQEIDRRHDLAGLTKTALRNVVLEPGLLHGMELVIRSGEAFDSGNCRVRDGRYRYYAGPLRDTIDMHSTCATLPDAAAVFRACHVQVVAEHPQQGRRLVAVESSDFLVYRE